MDEKSLFWTEREAAAVLRIHPSNLSRLARSGKCPVPFVMVGARRLYPIDAVRQLAKAAS